MDLYARIENANEQGGANFWYGLVLRPAGIACQPSGHSAIITHEMCGALFPAINDDSRAIRHGAIAYPQQLTEEQVERYDLQPLCATTGGLLSTSKQISESLAYDEVVKKLISILKNDLNTQSNDTIIAALKDGYRLDKAFQQFEVFTRRKELPELFEELNEMREYISNADLIDELSA